MSNEGRKGGGKITPPFPVAFTRVSLEPRNIQRYVFMTFPKYGPATEQLLITLKHAVTS